MKKILFIISVFYFVTVSPLTDSEKKFYSKNMGKFYHEKVRLDGSLSVGKELLIQFVVPLVAISAMLSFLGYSMNRYDNDLLSVVGSLLTFVASYSGSFYLMNKLKKKLEDRKKLNRFINVLKNYNPDLEKLGSDNYKLYIRQHLHSLLDKIWLDYKIYGRDFLSYKLKNDEKYFDELIDYYICYCGCV